MISRTLHNLFLLSVPLFIAHGVEEYLMGFYDVYPLFHNARNFFGSVPQATFAAFQITWWILLGSYVLFLTVGKWPLNFLTVIGIIYIYELHHLLKAAWSWSYYPGMWTAFLFPVIGFFFWKELINHFRKEYVAAPEGRRMRRDAPRGDKRIAASGTPQHDIVPSPEPQP